MAFSLASLFVDITSRGLDTVKTDLAAVQARLKETSDWASELRKSLSETPTSLKVKIAVENEEYIKQVKDELSKLPKSVQIKILEERIGAANKAANAKGATDEQKATAASLSQSLTKMKSDLQNPFNSAIAGAKSFSSALASMQSQLNAVGAVGKAAFASITATALAGVALASPRDWTEFKGAISLVSAEVGTIFLPLIRQVTDWLGKVAAWFGSLTDAQKDNLLHWAKVAAVVAVVIALMPTLATGINLVMGAMTGGLSEIIPLLTAVLLPLLPLMVGIFTEATDSSNSFWDGLEEAFTPVLSALTDAWKEIGPLISDTFSTVQKTVLPVISQIMSGVASMMTTLIPIAKQWLLPAFEQIKSGVTALMKYINALIDTIGAIGDTLAPELDEFKTGFEIVSNTLKDLFASVQINWGSFFDFAIGQLEGLAIAFLALVTVIERVAKQIDDTMKAAGEAIKDPIGAAKKAISGDFIKQAMDNLDPQSILAEANGKVDKFKGSFSKRQEDRANQANEAKPTGNHDVRVAREAPQVMGIADAWKRVQQSMNTEDPSLKIAQEQLREQKKTNENLEKGLPGQPKPFDNGGLAQ